MTFQKRLEQLSPEELSQLTLTVEKELNRREKFIQTVSTVALSELKISVNARSLLQRRVNKANQYRFNKPEQLFLNEVFTLLAKADWSYFREVSPKLFAEISQKMHSKGIDINQYYGKI